MGVYVCVCVFLSFCLSLFVLCLILFACSFVSLCFTAGEEQGNGADTRINPGRARPTSVSLCHPATMTGRFDHGAQSTPIGHNNSRHSIRSPPGQSDTRPLRQFYGYRAGRLSPIHSAWTVCSVFARSDKPGACVSRPPESVWWSFCCHPPWSGLRGWVDIETG